MVLCGQFRFGAPSLKRRSRVSPAAGTGSDPLVRAWKYIEPEPNSGCWLWVGIVSKGPGRGKGYGRFWLGGRRGGPRRNVMAHRFMYEQLVGAIPRGLQLDHLCRVPGCVNPAHLEPVTARENLMRGNTRAAANARKTICLRGHPLDDPWISNRGQRLYRKCAAIRQALRWVTV